MRPAPGQPYVYQMSGKTRVKANACAFTGFNSTQSVTVRINGYRPAADMALSSKSISVRSFQMSPELRRFDSQCSLSLALR